MHAMLADATDADMVQRDVCPWWNDSLPQVCGTFAVCACVCVQSLHEALNAQRAVVGRQMRESYYQSVTEMRALVERQKQVASDLLTNKL
jgi:hypothetical protein